MGYSLSIWCTSASEPEQGARLRRCVCTAGETCFALLVLLRARGVAPDLHRVGVVVRKEGWCAWVLQVVVLIGTGWSYMTPFLRDREKRILMIVIPLQACPC